MHVTAETLDETPIGSVISDSRLHMALHHGNAHGYISLIVNPGENWGHSQRHYPRGQIYSMLPETPAVVYFSQNTFYKRNRQLTCLDQLRALYVDLDFYKSGIPIHWVEGHIKQKVADGEIPEPNYLLYSGRGLTPVWLIEPEKKHRLDNWAMMQQYFAGVLEAAHPDMKACDASRVFRVAGSINQSSGAVVSIRVLRTEAYKLSELRREYLHINDNAPKPAKKATTTKTKAKAPKPGSLEFLDWVTKLHHMRYHDLLTLCEIRNYDIRGSQNKAGREVLLFLYRYWSCCFRFNPELALEDALELNRMLTYPLSENEVIRATSSAEKAWLARQDEEANKRAREAGYPGAGYNISNAKIIKWLGITDEEQMQLKTIRSEKIKKRQQRDSVSREEYLAKQSETTHDKLQTLKQMLQQGMTNAVIMQEMGVSKPYLHKLKKML